MFQIDSNEIYRQLYNQIIQAHHIIDPELKKLIHHGIEQETTQKAKNILKLLLQNAEIAEKQKIPLCQDTGLAVFFVQIGEKVQIIGRSLAETLNQVTQDAYQQGFLRLSTVEGPFRRNNRGANTPAIIHFEQIKGDSLKISFCAKGGGAENKSRLKMLNPTSAPEDVLDFLIETVELAGPDACPPFIIGIGIGGNFELAPFLAKKALLRPLDSKHPDPFYQNLETQWLNRINQTGIGPLGLKGTTTALRLFIEPYPCHIASLPVAVNINCHSHRHFSIELNKSSLG